MENTFNFNDQYILEDGRTILMPLDESDHIHLLPFSLNEPDLWKYSLVSAAGKKGSVTTCSWPSMPALRGERISFYRV